MGDVHSSSPQRGRNDKHPISILWQDGRTTQSMITWYGAAKHPFLNADMVGDLLVLIPKSIGRLTNHVLGEYKGYPIGPDEWPVPGLPDV